MMEVSDISIRAMTLEDLPSVMRIENTCFSDAWSEQSFRDDLGNENYCYLAATVEDQLVGYCGYLKAIDTADIVNVAVDPDFQRKGIGGLMLEALMDHGIRNGVSVFFLEVRMTNETAVRLYRKAGFEQIGVRKKYYTDPVEDALIFTWAGGN